MAIFGECRLFRANLQKWRKDWPSRGTADMILHDMVCALYGIDDKQQIPLNASLKGTERKKQQNAIDRAEKTTKKFE